MKTTYVPSKIVNSLSSPAQRMLLHIICELKTGRTYEESQRINLEYLHFVHNNILSKNSFYKAIKELKDHKIIYNDGESLNVYFVNYYYVNAMNTKQWNQFLKDVKSSRVNTVVNNIFTIVESNPTVDDLKLDLVTYKELKKTIEKSRKFIE